MWYDILTVVSHLGCGAVEFLVKVLPSHQIIRRHIPENTDFKKKFWEELIAFFT
jgi:hypothetical protein